jgi:hypothetical protein
MPGQPITGHRSPVTLLLALACAGCATVQPTTMEGNYLTYTHAFTDAAATAARRNAEKLCGDRKQVALRTGGTCSLTECVTHYQCVEKNQEAVSK